MRFNSLSLKPVVPITIALADSLQVDKAFSDASGLEKSISTSKSSKKSLRLSPLSKPAPYSTFELALTASLSA